ncbi:MAG: VOC family protein [Rhizobiales bacterium]|nr:VOC family protein [Hyphomicrobiales bacterium]
MDAPNPSAMPTFASRAPLHIGAVGLKVRDLGTMAGYYRHMLGLTELERTTDRVVLGAGGAPFLHLEHDAHAKPDDQREAGLYHTAFLMPTRADLARWILHLAGNRIPISGASDHTVSEAFYLDDPEGNGVEVYADRDPNGWVWTGDLVKITTDPLDIDGIVREVEPQTATYAGAPGGLRIGHIHLRVGDVPALERFYQDGVGFKVTRGGRNGASFMSTGRYHHHLAGNVWHSRGAGRRDPNRAGLAWFAIEATNPGEIDAIRKRLTEQEVAVRPIGGDAEATDPWGTPVRFVRA